MQTALALERCEESDFPMPHASLPKGPTLLSPQTWLLIYQPSRYYAWLRRRYGDIATVRLPGNSAVIALTPEGARQVFSSDPDTYDPFLKDGFTAIAGPRSIWVLEGPCHRRERLLLLSAFQTQRVRRYGQAIKEVTVQHTDAWQPGQDIRAYDVVLGISRDIILRMAFGIIRGAVLEEGRRILTKLMHSGHPLSAFFSAFRRRWFGPWARFQHAKDEFSMFVARLLAERRAVANEGHDILDMMLASRHEDGTLKSDEEIRDELIPLMFAGHQTTAVALSWALYELGRHPTVLGHLREELDALGPDPDPDVVAQQPYLRAVCDETLRLHTTVSEIVRVTRVPRELLGHAIPANTGIAVSLSAIHQDPSIYSEPDQFRPERFIERSYSPYEYVRFGGGHRRCPGANLAEYELPVVLATIVTRWEFELAGVDSEIRHNIGTGPKHGVRMQVKGRRSVPWPNSPCGITPNP